MIPVGVRLSPIAGKHVVYAVKLKAFIKPRGLLFAPWSEPFELDAVAGAKPFGSRIGPAALNGSAFQSKLNMSDVKLNGDLVCNQNPNGDCEVPQLTVGAGANFFDTEFLTQLKAIALGPQGYTIPTILKAQYHAMAPNPVEIGGYGIIPPPPANPASMRWEFIPYYDGKQNTAPETFTPPIYRFYAPIFKNTSGDPGQFVDNILKSTLDSGAVLPDPYGFTPQQVYDKAKNSIMGYIHSNLVTGLGSEHQETETLAAIEIPMANLQASVTKKFWVTEGRQVLTSWAPTFLRTNDRDFAYTPRFGYSVKFVALRDLIREGVPDLDSELESVSH